MIRVYIAIAALAVAALGGYKVTDWRWQSKWDAHMLADSQANEKAAADALSQQRELLTELEKVQQNANVIQAKYDADRASANDVAERLRSELSRIKALPKNNNSTAISIGANAATDRLLLSELLIESDRLAGIYAEQADRNKIAVINCNAEYNAVKDAVNGRRL